MKLKWKFVWLLPVAFGWAVLSGARFGLAAEASFACETPGWFPTSFGLKDHSIFQYQGQYYLVSNYVPAEKKFAYARSADFCTWEELPYIIDKRMPDAWDEMAVWAPFVLEENGVYYLLYTGVTFNFTQSILLATTTNPADPESWQEHGMIFQPNHAGMVWQADQWADNRDPHVIKVGEQYILYYTGKDVGGGIVGAARADSPYGPWTDLGAVYGPVPQKTFESATVFLYQNHYYLVFHQVEQGVSEGGIAMAGTSPSGPWGQPYPLQPGWAHEVWQDAFGAWITSYLTSYTVTISPLSWNPISIPARPFIGAEIHHVFLPVLAK